MPVSTGVARSGAVRARRLPPLCWVAAFLHANAETHVQVCALCDLGGRDWRKLTGLSSRERECERVAVAGRTLGRRRVVRGICVAGVGQKQPRGEGLRGGMTTPTPHPRRPSSRPDTELIGLNRYSGFSQVHPAPRSTTTFTSFFVSHALIKHNTTSITHTPSLHPSRSCPSLSRRSILAAAGRRAAPTWLRVRHREQPLTAYHVNPAVSPMGKSILVTSSSSASSRSESRRCL